MSFDLKDMHFILGATTDQLVKSCKAIAFCHLEPFQGGSIFYSIYYTLDSTPYSISTLVCSALLYSTLPYSPQYSSLDSTPYSTLLYSAPLLYSTLLSPLESRLLSYFSTSGLQDQPTGLKTSWQLHMFNFRNSEFLYKYSFHKN